MQIIQHQTNYNASHLNPQSVQTFCLSFGPKHLYDLSPKSSPFSGNSFLGFQEFSNRGQAGRCLVARGISSADAILLSWELASRDRWSKDLTSPYSGLAESGHQSNLFNFPLIICPKCFSVCSILVVLTWGTKCLLQTWDTNCRLPNWEANWVGKLEGLPNGRANLVLPQNIKTETWQNHRRKKIRIQQNTY